MYIVRMHVISSIMLSFLKIKFISIELLLSLSLFLSLSLSLPLPHYSQCVSCAGLGSVEFSEFTPSGDYLPHLFNCQNSITYQVQAYTIHAHETNTSINHPPIIITVINFQRKNVLTCSCTNNTQCTN